MVLDKESKAQYIPVPPALVRRLNSNAALLFMWLLDMHDIYSKPELNGWFFLVDKNMRETFGWGQDALKAAIDKLVKEGFLEKKRQGVGALVYYKIGSSGAVVSLFSSELGKSQMQGAENPLPTTAELVQNLGNPKSETGKPQILNLENPNSEFGKSQIRNGKTPNQILENPNSELGKSHISNNISNKDLNNQTKNKEKEEESADFANPLPPSDFSEEVGQISFLAAKLSKPENLSERVWGFFAALCKSKKKKFTKKGWGAATNKLVEGFNEFGETAMFEHLERWANSTTWTTPFFPAWREAIQKASPTAIVENDPRNTAENVSVTKKAFMRIKELYSKLGEGLVPSGGNDFEREKVVLKELWAELLAVTPAQPAEFEKELAIIETALKAEKAQRSNGKVTTQPKGFIGWIKSKGWLLFVKATKAVQMQALTKAQQPPKTTATAPQTAKAEPIQQIAPKAQISENKAPLPAPVPAVVSVPVSVSGSAVQEFIPKWLPGISYKYFVQDLVGKTSTKAGGFVYTMIAEGVFNSEAFIAWLKANIEGYPEASDIIDNKMRETWNALESQIKKAKTA